MKTVTAKFYLYENFLDQGELPEVLPLKLGMVERAYSTAFFCRFCGDIWGHIRIEGQEEYKIQMRRCYYHGSGSFQRGVGEMWKHFPRGVLEHEISVISFNKVEDFFDLVYKG